MTTPTGAPDAQLIAHMTRVATTAATAVQAIGQGDNAAARRAVDKLRMHWSTLRHGDTRQLQARFGRAGSAEGAEALFHGLQVLATCEEVVKLWTKECFEQAAGSGEALDEQGWHAVLDHLLPLRWNFECDVLLVHGRMPPELAAAIEARGQRRSLLAGPAAETPLPPGCVRVDDEQTLTTHLNSFKRLLPKRHVGIDVADGLLEPEAVQRMDAFVGTAIQNLRMSWITWGKHAAMWLRQGLDNLPAAATAPDINALGQRFAGRPAIVVSPGPSLSKNIGVLKAAQGRALLIAPLQTLKRLHREGIRPDFAVVLDSHDHASAPRDFIGDIPDAWLPDLIASNSAHANVLRRFAQARTYFFDAGGPLDLMLARAMSSPWPALSAGSVAVTCLRLAHHWGCSPIALVGQDLAFAADGQRYAAGAGRDAPAPQVLRELPGYHGGTVQTAPDYFLFHHQFQGLAATYRAANPELRLFNCTEGGASIAGFEQLPLHDMLQQHVLTLPPLPTVAPPAGTSRSGVRQREIATRLQQVIEQVKAGQAQVASSARHASQAHRGPEFLTRLGREDDTLRARVDRLQYLMEERMQGFDDVLTRWEASEELADYLRGSQRYRELAQEAFDGLLVTLNDTLQRLQGREPADAAASGPVELVA
ncbi:MAG: motility associated factor glycosyltransferase family protein [Hydrogenophaga sp.]|nr:motility associated factor glycosyltransferase family protein [Hydrogenophaga sp.]